MHPVIKVVSFLVVALFLTRAQVYGIVVTFAVLLALHIAGLRFDPHSTWHMLRRMRWLFASILVTYLWFTPGTPLIPLMGEYSPAIQGATEGLLRVVTLSMIVVQVGFLLQTTSREELVGAIRWLAAPLQIMGLDRDRLALRMVLILDSVNEVQSLLQQQMAAFSTRGRSVSCIANSAKEMFQMVLNKADAMPLHRITLAEQEWPPHRQWLYPVALVMLFGWIQY